MSIVSNATPLSELAKIGHLALLREVYGWVLVPEEVFAEVTAGTHPAVEEVQAAEWIEVRPVTDPGQVEALCFATGLGAGECAAIVLCEEIGDTKILLDDRLARREAEARGLHVIGTVATLLSAKRLGLISTVKGPLDALIAHGARIGRPLYRDALAVAGECDGE